MQSEPRRARANDGGSRPYSHKIASKQGDPLSFFRLCILCRPMPATFEGRARAADAVHVNIATLLYYGNVQYTASYVRLYIGKECFENNRHSCDQSTYRDISEEMAYKQSQKPSECVRVGLSPIAGCSTPPYLCPGLPQFLSLRGVKRFRRRVMSRNAPCKLVLL